jgi:DNA-binding MarR family transcriptional regulator
MTKRTTAATTDHVEAAKVDHLGQLLLRAARLFDEEGQLRARKQGLGDLRPAHLRLFPHIDWDGTRITELAERVGTTKQAVGQTVSELEAAGLLARRADPSDQRARLVVFTARGRSALLKGLGVLGDLEALLTEELGPRRIATLKTGLHAITGVLERITAERREAPPSR